MGIRLPPGLKFCPTDQDLIKFYLRYKLVGKTLLPPEFNSYLPKKILYGKTADEPSKFFAGRSEEYLYFFTQVNKKFANSSNSNYMDRIAGNGTWRIQKTFKVLDVDKKTLIGYRKNFTFDPKNKQQEEQNKPFKISYIMHEFTPLKYPPSSQNHQAAAEYWTVCKIRKMVTKNNNYKPPPSSSSVPITQGHEGRKRARTSSHELMLTTAPSNEAVMHSHQPARAEASSYHPCAKSLQSTSTYYDNNLPEFSQPHQSNYVAAQPDHEDAYDDEMSLFSSLDDLNVVLPHLEQESEDDVYPLNMGQTFTSILLADNDDTNM